MTPTRQAKWRDVRFQLFDRNPQIFRAFEGSLDELQTMVFDFSEQKKYTLTQHALSELRDVLSQYLVARADSLRVPTSTMAMFFPSELGFDPVLTRQLERFKAHAARGIANSEQEFTKQIIAVLAALSLSSLRSRSYFTEHGENSVTTFISAYMYESIRDAAIRRLDDVAMEGADHLRDLCNALIEKQLYVSALTHVSNLEQLATISVGSKSDVVLSVAVRGLSDCLLHNCSHGHPGTHVTSHLLESLFRITRIRLASPLGLSGTNVPYSVGPFISPTERSSYAAVNIAMVNAITESFRADRWSGELVRLTSLYEELHNRAWLDFAELGSEAVKTGSFLLHFLNSTVEETVRANIHLIRALDRPTVEERTADAAMEQRRRDRFRGEIKNKVRWETTGIYSRIVPAMFEHQQLSFLHDTIKLQRLFAFWAMGIDLAEVAAASSDSIRRACMKLQDPVYHDEYASARLAIHIAQIGIYAIAMHDDAMFRTALGHYREVRRTFQERYPNAAFVGNFDDAEHELLDERPGGMAMLDPGEAEFYSTVTPEQIQLFFAALE